MRILKRIVALSFLAMFGGLLLANATPAPVVHPNSAATQEQDTCVPFATIEAKATVAGWTTAELTGIAKSAWLAHYNSLPPVSNVQPAHLYGSSHPQSPNMVIIFVDNQGCIQDIENQDPDQFLSWATDPGV